MPPAQPFVVAGLLLLLLDLQPQSVVGHLALTLLYVATTEEAVAGPERADACSGGWLFA